MRPKLGKEAGILILLFVLCTVTGLVNHAFVSPANLQNTARLIGIYGTFSLGVSLVIITGGIDLSVGSVFALLGVVLTMLMTEKQSPFWLGLRALHVPESGVPFVACAVVLALAALMGWGHGFLVARAKLQPFIVTLCGLLFYRGLARFVVRDETRGFSDVANIDWLREMTSGNLFGLVPAPFVVLLAVAGVLFVLVHRSVWGRHLLAVGRNEEAARYAGIPTGRVVTAAYVLCSLLAGVSTIQIAFYTNSVSPSSHGNFYELYAIAASVLGGCSLRGGEGSVVGVLLGTALLQVLRNLVNILGIPTSLDFAVMGAVILIGVLGEQVLRNRKRS